MFNFLQKKTVPDLFPDKTWLYEINKEHNFTPDMWRLQQRAKHLIFVYNEYQSRQHKHDLIGDNRLAAAFTEASNLVMWKKKLGNETFPFALEIKPEQTFGNSSFLGKPARISGELYSVPPQTIKAIDTDQLNEVYFQRKRVTVVVPFRYKDGSQLGSQLIQRVKAWMYVGPDEFWLDQLDMGQLYAQVKLYPANNETLGNYYHFNERLESNSE